MENEQITEAEMEELKMLENEEIMNDKQLLMQELGQIGKNAKEGSDNQIVFIKKKLSPQEELLRINNRLDELTKKSVECKKLNKKAEVN